MKVPLPIPGIVDLTALQNAVALCLLSDDRLAAVPVVPEIRLHTESDLQVDALWTLPRQALNVTPSGVNAQAAVTDAAAPLVGAGLLVEMPTGANWAQNLPGPGMVWSVSVVAFEERNVNFSPQGTGLMAEQLAQLAQDALHLQELYTFGVLYAKVGASIAPAHDWMAGPHAGLNCWRATLECKDKRAQTVRTAYPSFAFAGGFCALACADLAATILFTLDGSAPFKANPNAVVYQGPFPVQSGQTVLAAAWKAGQLPSGAVGSAAP